MEGRGSDARDDILHDLNIQLQSKHDQAYRIGLTRLAKEREEWNDHGIVSWQQHKQDTWMGLINELMERKGLHGELDIDDDEI
jgi:hypothetical protein